MKTIPINEQAITLLMENGPGDFDVKAFIMQKDNDFPPRIVVTYEVLDSEGEQLDAGIEGPEEGQVQQPDTEDLKHGETAVTLAVQFLKAHHISTGIGASASFFYPGLWYNAEDESDYRTGETTRRSFHLKGFLPEQEKEIHNALSKK